MGRTFVLPDEPFPVINNTVLRFVAPSTYTWLFIFRLIIPSATQFIPLKDVVFYPPTNEYHPVVFLNDYWNLNEDYKPVNETTPTLPISLTFAPLSLFKWQLYAAQASRKDWFSNILGDISLNGETEDDEEQDTLKVSRERLLYRALPYGA